MGSANGLKRPEPPLNRRLLVLLSVLAAASLVLFWGPGPATAGQGPSYPLKILKFAAGVISAYGLHESGHALAARLTNTDLEWGVGTYNQPLGFREKADSDFKGGLIHSAGLVTQTICSEVILRDETIDRNGSFVRGMMFWNVFNPLIYALDYWLIGSTNKVEQGYYQGDIGGIEHYWGSAAANLFAASVAGLAICQGYRFLRLKDRTPGRTGKSFWPRLGLLPSRDGGVILRLEIQF